ncbi:hypothetical protein KBY93_06310 [Synechococcus sp. J7-Johnson]|nr:hypothetical protein [Synechococcus sp. J7-Johnson]
MSFSSSRAVAGASASPSMLRHTLNHSWLAVSEPMRACSPSAHHQGGVVLKERGNLGFVGLQLGVGAPDGGAFSSGVLELDQAQGQAVEEHHQVGTAVVLAVADAELIHHQPVVGAGISEIHQPHMVAGDAAIGPGVFHWNPLPQQAVEGAVRLHQRRRGQAQQLAQGLLTGLFGDGRVELADGLAQPAHQHHIAERLPFRRRFTGGEIRAMAHRIAQLLEPAEGRLFDEGFVEGHGGGRRRNERGAQICTRMGPNRPETSPCVRSRL